jgi:ADP-heptose:LPS heptosyltransferase
VAELAGRGRRVVLTGTAAERELTAAAAGELGHRHGDQVIDLGGRTSLAELASVVARADAVMVANTGVAHLAAAVRTPVVSLFAPVVPAACWAPYGVPVTLLGDQRAACRGSRAVHCRVPGHPCLTQVSAAAACDALDDLTARSGRAAGSAASAGQARTGPWLLERR